MKRIALIALALCASAAFLVVGTAAGGDEGTYEVRAIFDNAGFLVTGEEVRVAGAKVGSISDIDVTGTEEVAHEDGSAEAGKAVVVMRIDDPAFHDFRQDASCLIRPQSLIGEKFVECQPTQPRAADTVEASPLEQVGEGEPGEGQYLLPVERNGKAVDIDLLNNIMKEPYPDRFRLILNNLGASFAARGEELAEIVERSNPALRETNELLATLARQNHTLAKLSTESDQVITALASEREHIKGFINESNVAAQATAERSADLEESFVRFPGFLRELRSTMGELDRFSTAATPVFSDLGDAAPSLTRATKALGPFSDAGVGALTSLGDAAEEAGPMIVDSDPVIRQIRGLAESGQPAATNLRRLLASMRKTEGFRYLAELFFNGAGTVNAFDSYGHFLRTLLPLNNCVVYEEIVEPGCGATFYKPEVVFPGAKRRADKQAEGALEQALRALGDALAPAGQSSGGRVPEAPVQPPIEETPEPVAPATPPAEQPAPVPESGAQPPAESGVAPEPTSARRLGPIRDLLDYLVGPETATGGSR
jgi:ABC-type transporter Mla subunit MlaD